MEPSHSGVLKSLKSKSLLQGFQASYKNVMWAETWYQTGLHLQKTDSKTKVFGISDEREQADSKKLGFKSLLVCLYPAGNIHSSFLSFPMWSRTKIRMSIGNMVCTAAWLVISR